MITLDFLWRVFYFHIILLNGIYIRVFEYINPVYLLSCYWCLFGYVIFQLIGLYLQMIIILKYYKEFEKMDKSWHREMGNDYWAFCVGGILAFFGGIIALFCHCNRME